MFEVGKKYLYRPNGNVPPGECVFVGDHISIIKYPSGREDATNNTNFTYWTEVVEPRREFFNACRDNIDGTYYTGPYPTHFCADGNKSPARYGVLELIHHSDTKVESIFHLVKK